MGVVYFKRRKLTLNRKIKKDYLDDNFIQMESQNKSNYNSINTKNYFNDLEEDLNST